MHIVSGEFPEVNLFSNNTSHIRDSSKLSREPSAESFLTTGLGSLRSAGTPGWLESHQWQNMLWVSDFERKRRGLALSNRVEFALLSTNPTLYLLLLWWLSGKNSACNAGDEGSSPGSGRSPGSGHGNPLQCSCLENCMDRGAWWATVHRVTKSWTWLEQLSTHTHPLFISKSSSSSPLSTPRTTQVSCSHSAQLHLHLLQTHTKVIKNWKNKQFAQLHNHLS